MSHTLYSRQLRDSHIVGSFLYLGFQVNSVNKLESRIIATTSFYGINSEAVYSLKQRKIELQRSVLTFNYTSWTSRQWLNKMSLSFSVSRSFAGYKNQPFDEEAVEELKLKLKYKDMDVCFVIRLA